ncbi:helix-turn-helix domain-containing protein [Sinorhizobium meliloti]|uniref:helix-turn-helix domain-containing protein n=1 Tax=Rhizobium meliloti TaxID=382 RepID=UPI00399975EE
MPLRVPSMIVADNERRPFSPKTLAEHWDCSERHVRNLIGRGEIRAFRLGGKLLRIAWDKVDRFEREGGSK